MFKGWMIIDCRKCKKEDKENRVEVVFKKERRREVFSEIENISYWGSEIRKHKKLHTYKHTHTCTQTKSCICLAVEDLPSAELQPRFLRLQRKTCPWAENSDDNDDVHMYLLIDDILILFCLMTVMHYS